MIINTDYIKTPANLVVGFSVGAVATRIIKNNAVPETKLQSIQVFVAAMVLAGMVAKAAQEYTDEKIDGFFEKYEVKDESQPVPETENQE